MVGSSGPGDEDFGKAPRWPAGGPGARPIAAAGYDPFSAPDANTGYDPYAAAPASPAERPAAYPSPEAPPPPPPQLQQQQHGTAPGRGLGGQPGAGYDPFLEPPPTESPTASRLPQPEQRSEPWHREVPHRIAADLWPHSGPQQPALAEQLPPWQRAGQGASSFAPAHVAPTWPPPQTPQQSPPVPLQQMHRDPLPGPVVRHPQSQFQQGQHDQRQAQPAPRFLGRMHRAQAVEAPGQVPAAFGAEPTAQWHQQPRELSPRGGTVPGAYDVPQRSYPPVHWGSREHGARPQQQQPALSDVPGGPPHPAQHSWAHAPHHPQWDIGQVGPRPWGAQPPLQQQLFPQHQPQSSAPHRPWDPPRGW